MSQGKFSNPRPYRDEERQIEETFRQLTNKPSSKSAPQPKPRSVPQTRAEAAVKAKTGGQYHPPQIVEEPPEPTLEELLREDPIAQLPVEEAFPKPLEDSFDLNFAQEDPELFTAPPVPPQEGRYARPEPRPAPVRQPRQAPPVQPPQEDFEEAPEDFLDKAMAFFGRNRMPILVGLCAAAILMIVCVGSLFASSASDPYDGKILPNIYVGEIYVGEMTRDEAVSALKAATSQTYAVEDMVIDLGISQFRLSPKDTGASLDAKAAVAEAYSYGRTGTEEERDEAVEALRYGPYYVGILPYLNLDHDYIQKTLASYAENAGSTLTQTTYGLQGKQPKLDAENFDEDAPTQTLVITMGTPGVGFDAKDVYDQILDAYSLHTFLVEVDDVEAVREPDPVDLEAIYKEFYIAPKDATIDYRDFEVIPGSYGYGFDLEEAQRLVDNAAFGEEIRIPMEYIAPEILDEDMFFRDVLGSAATSFTSDSNRDANLRLACNAIHGTVLNPGETFSFFDVVGEPSSRNGYQKVETYVGTELTKVQGEGISQVASTLYQAALLADMEIVSRVSHDFVPSFTDYGMDANVSWRAADFRFRNSSGYPITIEADVANGRVSIQLLGTEEREYYVQLEYEITNTYKPETEYEEYPFDNREGYEDGDVIQEGITGYQVKTYKCKYDRSSGVLLNRDFEATSRYSSAKRILAKVEQPPETTVPETQPETTPPTQPPVSEPTVPSETEGALVDPVTPLERPHDHGGKAHEEAAPEGAV